MAEQLPFRYLAVDGPIGVGKTSLVDRLVRRFEAVKVLEDVENPFLPDFYQDRSGAAFQTQMYFLLSRFKQQEALLQTDLFSGVVVSDYLFAKDRIFAELTLSTSEMGLYDSIFNALKARIRSPDLVVYLHAPMDVILERIARREDEDGRAIAPGAHAAEQVQPGEAGQPEVEDEGLVGRGGERCLRGQAVSHPVGGESRLPRPFNEPALRRVANALHLLTP